jgi:proteasome lid subunit RPN8/RPN11
MAIRMSRVLYQALLRYCRSKLPEEACGFIRGFPIEGGFFADSFAAVTNSSSNPREHFRMLPSEVVPILYKKEPSPYQIIGIFHSHPSMEANLSKEDAATQWHTLPTHWIVSFQHESEPVLQIFDIKKANPTGPLKLSFVISQ